MVSGNNFNTFVLNTIPETHSCQYSLVLTIERAKSYENMSRTLCADTIVICTFLVRVEEGTLQTRITLHET